MKTFILVCIGMLITIFPVVMLGKKTLKNMAVLLLVLLVVVALFVLYVMVEK